MDSELSHLLHFRSPRPANSGPCCPRHRSRSATPRGARTAGRSPARRALQHRPVPQLDSFAKNAAAFFRKSRSSRSWATSFRSRCSSASSERGCPLPGKAVAGSRATCSFHRRSTEGIDPQFPPHLSQLPPLGQLPDRLQLELSAVPPWCSCHGRLLGPELAHRSNMVSTISGEHHRGFASQRPNYRMWFDRARPSVGVRPAPLQVSPRGLATAPPPSS